MAKTLTLFDKKTGATTGCVRLDKICSFFRNEENPRETDIIYPSGGHVTIPVEFDEFLIHYEQTMNIKTVPVSNGVTERPVA